MIFKTCKFNKILLGRWKKKLTFPLLLFDFFSHLQIFLKKIGIDTHLIGLSCHQKFEKIHWPEAEILVHKVGNMEN